jgi:hypothetical protein
MQDLLTFMIISAVVRKLELEKRLNNSAKNNTPKNDELFVNDLEEELHRSKELIATIEKYFELTQNKKCQKSKLNTDLENNFMLLSKQITSAHLRVRQLKAKKNKRLRKNMSIEEKILIEQRLGKQFHSSKK